MINFHSVTKKTQKNIIQIRHKFMIIHIEYQQLQSLHLEKQVHFII